MLRKSLALLGSVFSLSAVLVVAAQAQQHKALRLGNPATRFSKPLKQGDDLRLLLRAEKTRPDVAAVLGEVGWAGDLADLDQAAASAEITPYSIPSTTRLPFMAARKKGKAYAMTDVLWAGKKPIDAFAFEFSSKCVRYRLVAPKACGNFWVEELGKDEADPKCSPPPPPVVSLAGPAEACVTQPVEYTITVKNPPADNAVRVSVDGREVASDKLSNGSYRFTYPGAATPGRHQVTATSGGVTGTSTVEVKPCLPTCAISVSPDPAKAGKPLTVDLTGSKVAPGVKGGIRSAKVDVVNPKGDVTQSFEMGAGSLSRNDVVIKKGGLHTLRAVVTDEAGQASTNECTTQVDLKRSVPIFLGGYFGKERLTHDEADDHDDVTPFAPFSRCAPLAGFELGFQPMIGDNAQFEAAVGIKFPVDEDDSHTALFADAAINRVLSKGFVGGGVSFWDIGKDSSGVGLLVQGGVDLDKDGKWQFVGQTRVPFFNQFDNIDNNYQFWGGIRFRPSGKQ
jgi:hypothetical protein